MDMASAWMLVQSAVAQAAEQAAQGGISGADFVLAMKVIAAGLAIGIGVFGPGLSEGYAAAKAVEGIARNPGSTNDVTRTLLIGQAVAESNSIYALVIALLILLVV